jgi:hypothetical protein
VGITMDCAPVADVLAPECHAIIGDRAFGDTPSQVITLARAQAEGLLDEGILPIVKHIPGHGRATMDSHETLPIVTASLAELEACDFAVFKALNDLPLAMTAHILYTALDDTECATFSTKVMAYIRNVIGLVRVATLARGRRYAVVILLSIAAVITPPDILSQVLLFIPLYALYEVSILLGRVIEKRRVVEVEEMNIV